jgi:3-deoxy-D-manno-octulosonic-acid transferase
MTRIAYTLAWWLAAPFAWLRLMWRGRLLPGYRTLIGERFGRYGPVADAPRIWIHAVSVGETRAARPVIEALAASHPGHRILLTHMTPTGRATGEELFGDRVERAWLPYDMGFAVRSFIRHYRPALGVIMETEIWPRLIEECAKAGIPVVLANARLSERSARRYGRFPAFARWALANLAGIAAQTEADARRFTALGARDVAVTGNVKFDLEVPAETAARARAMRGLFGESRPVWVAGSTREGEEALLLAALATMPEDVLLVIVPRHPQRFDEVAEMARERGLAVVRRSAGARAGPAVRVVVGDSMGEMLAYYGAADVVLMGGSFLEYGSQNLIEACALGKPVVFGRHTYNFEEAAEGALAAGAAIRVEDAAAALEAALALTRDPARREAMGRKGRDFVAAHRGAAARLSAWIESRRAAASRGRAPG